MPAWKGERPLRQDRVDMLVLSREYEPGPGRSCDNCGHVDVESERLDICPECGGCTFRQFNIKEAMARTAAACDCPVEVVEQSDELIHLGGVGCLLSYRLPDEY